MHKSFFEFNAPKIDSNSESLMEQNPTLSHQIARKPNNRSETEKFKTSNEAEAEKWEFGSYLRKEKRREEIEE